MWKKYKCVATAQHLYGKSWLSYLLNEEANGIVLQHNDGESAAANDGESTAPVNDSSLSHNAALSFLDRQ